MARIAFCLPALPSHAAVHGALARALAARGHDVHFIGSRALAPLARRERVAVRTLRGDEGDLRGAGLLRTLRLTAQATALWSRLGPQALADLAPDLVIADQAEPGASLAAEAAGLRRATLAAALPLDRDEAIPPPFVDWPFVPGAAGRRRNRGGWRVADALMGLQRRALLRGCRDHQLPPRGNIDDWIAADLDLRQMVPALDFPHALPQGAAPVGPLRDGGTEPLDLDTGDRRVVFVSLGTLPGQRRALLTAICAAAASLPVQVLLAHAGSMTGAKARQLPRNVLARDLWPQAAVLDRAAACITHAGMNTALDCVAARVPMLAVPLAFEQPATAARLAYHGVARVIPRRAAGAQNLHHALRDVLDNPAYRTAIEGPAAALAAAGGTARAADLVEALLAGRAAAPPPDPASQPGRDHAA